MSRQWRSIERTLFLSVTFTIAILAFRFLYFGERQFAFYLWNFFLAVIPLLISRQLAHLKKLNITAIFLLIWWLLFLPNAPYIVTDIFHFSIRPPVPEWYDLLLVTSAAWNGLIIGIVSLLQVEEFLAKWLSVRVVKRIMVGSIISCAFGVYVGRFMRFNSWDILTRPAFLLRQVSLPFIYPTYFLRTWAFTILFSILLWLIYRTVKTLSVFKTPAANISE